MKITNDEFLKLVERYKPACNRWYRHAYKSLRIQKDDFEVEFQYVLFKSMLRFNIEKATGLSDRFERYFMSSLKKRINSLRRKNISKKNKAQQRCVPLSPAIDLEDDRYLSGDKEAEFNDMLAFCSSLKDKGIIRLRWAGATAKEVCQTLDISAPEYRKIMERVRSNSRLKHTLSRD